MPDMIVTHRLTKYYGRRRAVDALDLRVAQGLVYGLWDATGPANRPSSRCSWGWSIPDYGRAEVFGEDSMISAPKRGRGSPIWPKGIPCIPG